MCLDVPALAALVKSHPTVFPLSMESDAALLGASELVVTAVRIVASARIESGDADPITQLEILLATRPRDRAGSTHDPIVVDAMVDTVPSGHLVIASLAFLFASRPQQIVRRVSHQMDRCSGTNISRFVFGGFSLAIATDALDAWCPDTMVPGHSKFAPDSTANKLANKYAAAGCMILARSTR